MTIKPLNNQVLCRCTPLPLPSGLVVAHVGDLQSERKPKSFSRLTVLEIGPGKLVDSGQRIAINLQEGESVVVHPLAYKAGRVIELDPALFSGEELVLVDAGDLIGTTDGNVEPYAPAPKILEAKRQPPVLVH